MPAWLAEAGVDMPDIAPAIAKSSRCPGGRALAVPAIAVPRPKCQKLVSSQPALLEERPYSKGQKADKHSHTKASLTLVLL
jgi:hypothetical protein